MIKNIIEATIWIQKGHDIRCDYNHVLIFKPSKKLTSVANKKPRMHDVLPSIK